jgi:ABC-2 type transport system permease protein
MGTQWLAVEKIVAGMIQALVSGLVVIPAAWLTMGAGVRISVDHLALFGAICLLVALLSAAGGLALGCSVGQTQIGLMYSLVVAPMMMFGCAYYPWSALRFAPVLQYAVLINPLVYASEGLRGALMPEVPHIPGLVAVGALAAIDGALLVVGLRQFERKTVG